MVAKKQSRCKRCGQLVIVGERIDYSRLNGALHLACSDGADPEDEIRATYTSTLGLRAAPEYVLSDSDAFDECVKQFGYVPTLRALLKVSPTAQRKDAEYQRR